MRVETGPGWELRLGDCREVLADVPDECAVITDPPYSGITHEGQPADRAALGYDPWDARDVLEFFARWGDVDGWVCVQTDDYLAPTIRDVAREAGRYVFKHVPILQHGRRSWNDGPADGGHYLAPSRPTSKRFVNWGFIPGWYMADRARDGIVLGAKPEDLQRAIVRDYSRPGDLIVDPYAGGATTLLAAVAEGRRAIGAEVDPVTFEKAVARLRRGFTPDLFAEAM